MSTETTEDLEKRLAATRAAREAKAAERAEAAKAKRVTLALEREERMAQEDEKFAELEEKHGDSRLGRINLPRGEMVVVKAPVGIVYDRLVDEMMRSDSANPKVRTSAAAASAKAARECVVYPDRAAYSALAEQVASLNATVVQVALELGKAEAVDDAGK